MKVMISKKNNMKRKFIQAMLLGAFLSSTYLLTSCASEATETAVNTTRQQAPDPQQVIQDWPETPKKVANQMIEKYGQPNEMTPTRLIWFNNGDWKRTIVYKEEVPHDFPMSHTDVLEQTIDYKTPIDKYDEITAYDGSVFMERTKGEISARCDMEAANFLAVNLGHEVATGKRNVKNAREFYARTIMKMKEGEQSKYTSGFTFQLPKGDQRDPDESIMDQVMSKK